MTRAAGMWAPISPVGSTLCTRVPASAPPCWWKYQYGMPFCIGMTTVSGPRSFGNLGGDRRHLVSLHPQNDHVLRAGGRVVGGRPHVRGGLLGSVGPLQAQPLTLQCLEVRPARDQGHVFPGQRQADPDVPADGADTDDRDLHCVG